jgi:hypothetical protein
MPDFKSVVKPEDLDKLNDKVYQRGHVDREHLMEFMTIIPTNDEKQIVGEVEAWLTSLHNNPKFDKVVFMNDDVNRVLGDLDSYGRVQPGTILEYKQQHSRVVPTS